MLSTLRLLAAPLTGLMIWDGRDGFALGLFAAAGLSDALDGWLAKHFGFTSRFGAWLDPAADKLLMLVSFICLALVGASPWWLCAVVIGRDVLIVLGVLSAKALAMPLIVKPLIVGKISTAVQVAYVLLVLFLLAGDLAAPGLCAIGAWVVTALAAASLAAYALVWLRALGGRGNAVA